MLPEGIRVEWRDLGMWELVQLQKIPSSCSEKPDFHTAGDLGSFSMHRLDLELLSFPSPHSFLLWVNPSLCFHSIPPFFPSWKSLSRPRRLSRNLGWMGISTFPSDPWKSRNRDSELRDIPQPHFQRLWLDGIQRKIPKPQNSSLGSAGAEEIQPLKRKT